MRLRRLLPLAPARPDHVLVGPAGDYPADRHGILPRRSRGRHACLPHVQPACGLGLELPAPPRHCWLRHRRACGRLLCHLLPLLPPATGCTPPGRPSRARRHRPSQLRTTQLDRDDDEGHDRVTEVGDSVVRPVNTPRLLLMALLAPPALPYAERPKAAICATDPVRSGTRDFDRLQL